MPAQLRLIKKSMLLAVRSKRRFLIFTIIYVTLMAWMCASVRDYTQGGDLPQLAIALFSTITLSILYAWTVINYRKQEIATLKCIGYTNNNVRTIIVGELFFVTIIAFIILFEAVTHAYSYYGFIENEKALIFDAVTMFSVFGVFIAAQFIGIMIMYRKILRLRPIIALRVMK